MVRKHQVVMLPTEKASTNFSILMNTENKLRLPANPFKYNAEKYNKEGFDCYHLYIISNEEIKEGDWTVGHNEVKEADKAMLDYLDSSGDTDIKKIIATTDPDLTLNQAFVKSVGYLGIPAISQDFIEAYVKAYNVGDAIKEVQLEYVWKAGLELLGNNDYFLKLREDNTVIIHKIKEKKYTREEVEIIFTRAREKVRTTLNGTYYKYYNLDACIEDTPSNR